MKQTGLIELLPHGLDSAGPEHSSIRYERMFQVSEKSKGKGKRDRSLTILNGIHPNLYNGNSSQAIHMNTTKVEKPRASTCMSCTPQSRRSISTFGGGR